MRVADITGGSNRDLVRLAISLALATIVGGELTLQPNESVEKQMLRILKQNWFLIVLVVALTSGYLLSASCRPLAESSWLKWVIVALTMFVMALPVSFASLKETMGQYGAPLLAIVLNIILVPLVAWPLASLLSTELGSGLIVAAAAPCTLASAAVWTRRAGGNDTAAILVTIFTNSFCFVITPTWVFLLIGQNAENAKLGGTVYKLLFLVVMPMVFGQLLRANSTVAIWSTENKKLLGTLAQIGVLSVVFIGAIATGLRIEASGEGLNLGQSGATVLLVGGIHVFVLILGFRLARLFGFTRENQIAVAFAGSQKTLMVGLSTAMELGVSIIPIVAFHSVQLIVDTLIADRFAARSKAGGGTKETASTHQGKR